MDQCFAIMKLKWLHMPVDVIHTPPTLHMPDCIGFWRVTHLASSATVAS